METGHVVPAQIRQFPRAKVHEMGVKHPPIIARGAFPWCMSFEILLGKIPKGWLMEPILSHLCRIAALRDRSHVSGSQLARLIHGERAIRPDREASHPSTDALVQDKGFSPFGDSQRKTRQLRIAHKHLAR